MKEKKSEIELYCLCLSRRPSMRPSTNMQNAPSQRQDKSVIEFHSFGTSFGFACCTYCVVCSVFSVHKMTKRIVFQCKLQMHFSADKPKLQFGILRSVLPLTKTTLVENKLFSINFRSHAEYLKCHSDFQRWHNKLNCMWMPALATFNYTFHNQQDASHRTPHTAPHWTSVCYSILSVQPSEESSRKSPFVGCVLLTIHRKLLIKLQFLNDVVNRREANTQARLPATQKLT